MTEGGGVGVSDVCRFLGLGAAWAPVLEGVLPRPDGVWTIDALQQWRRRLLSSFDDLSVADLRAVAAAARPGAGAPVAARSRPRLEVLALTVAVAMAGDEAGWRRRRGRTGQALLERGLRQAPEARANAQNVFEGLWANGASRDQIAATLGLSISAAERLAHRASPRLGYQQVTSALGWSRDNLRLRRRNGSFPAPDGVDRGRAWWWPATVEKWLEAAGLRPCPACGARVEKLPQHLRVHQRAARAEVPARRTGGR